VIPWLEKTWCIPPKADTEFVARMEDLLELYQLPYDPRFPVVGRDEMPKQLIAETRIPLPVRDGHPKLYDSEYERKGVCNLFLFVEPLRGWRKVFVRDRRTKVDWAECVRVILDRVYPQAIYVRLVQDNLNTHPIGSLSRGHCPRGGAAPGASVGDPSHPGTRQLAEHGGDGTLHTWTANASTAAWKRRRSSVPR